MHKTEAHHCYFGSFVKPKTYVAATRDGDRLYEAVLHSGVTFNIWRAICELELWGQGAVSRKTR